MFVFTFFFLLYRIGMKMTHGKTTNFLLTSPTDVGKLQSIMLKWDYIQNPLDLTTICLPLVCSKNLYVKSVAVTAMNYMYHITNRIIFNVS